VKGTGQHLRSLTSDHVLFFSYRWFAWVVAGLMIVLPGRGVSYPPLEAALLLLSGVVNVVATAASINYVRITRRRWWFLGLDIVGSMVFVWITGSQFLPFLPLALGSLILPTLLYQWRGALFGALLFAALDLTGLIVAAQIDLTTSTAQSFSALRVLVPFGFVLLVALIWQLLQRASTHIVESSPDILAQPTLDATQREATVPGRSTNRRDPAGEAEERTVATNAFDRPTGSPFAIARVASERGIDTTRHVLSSTSQGVSVQFGYALSQIVDGFHRTAGMDIRLRTLGSEQLLPLAQQQLLLRLAHESLLNVQQHAQAQVVLLTVQYEPRAVSMTIQDDGVGLLDGTYERPGVHSLRAMYYRFTELDGQLEVFEGQTGGVTVRATLPLEH
jgi:hypothetical protein